jgi:exodeoxyribonuclease V alpha subunit
MEKISGYIERIVYVNEENSFTVAKLKEKNKKNFTTIVGNLASVKSGESLTAEGQWVVNKKFGLQFQASSYQTANPVTLSGIKKYLSSSLIKGIGSVMAERIVAQFGEKTLEVMENKIQRLSEVEGIGKKRIEWIKKAWQEQKNIREIMIFLQSQGITATYASKIYRTYGQRSIEMVKENPYRLAMDIQGIGFIAADKIAHNMGIEKSSSLRIEAGVLFTLSQITDEGHVYYPYQDLIFKSSDILKVDRENVIKAIAKLSAAKSLFIEDINQDIEDFQPNCKIVYLPPFYWSEIGCGNRLKKLKSDISFSKNINIQDIIAWAEKRLNIKLSETQIQAVTEILKEKVIVITGGPGTGKTTIINVIVQIFKHIFNKKVLLAAPTGRAAKRMSEVCGQEAKTIHRLLEYSFKQGGFQRDETNQLDTDIVIIDETSMIDIVLMNHLLKAIPSRASLIMVGDINQLPSVGPGTVLNDIINSEGFPVIRLTEIFRQAEKSLIVVNAHRINKGELPYLDEKKTPSDFYFISEENPEKVLEKIVALCKDVLPQRFNLDPINDIQLITPMHKGVVGVSYLNLELQKILNPQGPEISHQGRIFRVRDKVMQIKNDYDKDVYNGDIGRIVEIKRDVQELYIDYDGVTKIYDFKELDEIIHAYAISVHKSQGNEYTAIIMPVVSQHYIMLQRNLLYTGLTRGKKLVVLVGTKRALQIAIRNNKPLKRYSLLKQRLILE